MSSSTNDKASIENLSLEFDKQLTILKDKYSSLGQSTDQEKEFYTAFTNNLSQLHDSLDDYEKHYQAESKTLYEEHKKSDALMNKDLEFYANAEKYLALANEELSKKKKSLSSAIKSMRASLSNCKGNILASFKVVETPSLFSMYSILHSILYNVKKEDFDWNSFKATALIKDRACDLIVRASTLDPMDVPKGHVEEIITYKLDDKLKKAINESINGDALLDVLYYLEYIPECHRIVAEIDEVGGNIEEIEKEIVMRKLKTELVKDRIEMLEETFKYLNDTYEVTEHKTWIQDSLSQTKTEMERLDERKIKLPQEIQEIYEKGILKVPKELYE